MRGRERLYLALYLRGSLELKILWIYNLLAALYLAFWESGIECSKGGKTNNLEEGHKVNHTNDKLLPEIFASGWVK